MGTFPGGNIIRVTPTLSTDAYAQGDVLFNPTKIPNAVSSRGGVSKLIAMTLIDQSDVGTSDITFIFSENNSSDLGTINATANISDANVEALKITGTARCDADQAGTDSWLENTREHQILPAAGTGEGTNPTQLIKAAEGSTDVYVSGILISNTTPTYAADDIDLIFHIEYLG